jgi:C4-dicarboxylate-specific signal transduction histidine kinase
LPQITERLKATLDKLQRPQVESGSDIPAAEWWGRLRDRHAGDTVRWVGGPLEKTLLSAALFDSVAENLLQNALVKQQYERGLEITVELTVDRNNPVLAVSDNGQAIAPAVANRLLKDPVQSAYGLGIGLYHAARQAEEAGYVLDLAENRPGAVRFTLAPRSQAPG